MSRIVELLCEIDIEQSFDSFHAHAIPQGVEIGPGDVVLVHGVPTDIAFGETFTGQCRATLTRASWFGSIWTQCCAIFELTELFEVGFQPIDQEG
jgi:hypothetical protein